MAFRRIRHPFFYRNRDRTQFRTQSPIEFVDDFFASLHMPSQAYIIERVQSTESLAPSIIQRQDAAFSKAEERRLVSNLNARSEVRRSLAGSF